MAYINPTTYPSSFGRAVRLYYEERNVNTEANTSDIYWELQGYNRATDSTGWYYAGPFNVTINGVKVANNLYPSGSRIQLRDGTVVASGTLANIAHDTDGSKTVSVSFSCSYISDATQTASGSGSIDLTTIPRASTLSVPDGIFGSDWAFTISSVSSTYTHTVTVTIGSTTVTQSGVRGTVSFGGTTTRAWASAAPTSDTATVTVTCETFSGETSIGTTTATASFSVPASWAPYQLQPTRVEGVGVFNDAVIQNVSKARITIRYGASYGASLSSVTVYGPGINSTTQNPGASLVLTTDTLPYSGTQTWTITVKDTRGRATTQKVTLDVTAYKLPTVKLTYSRCDADGTANDLGAYMTATAVCTFDTSITSNAGYVYLSLGTTLIGSLTAQTSSPYTLTTSPVAASSTQTYEITATVEDEVLVGLGDAITITARLSTAQVLMDFKDGGDGVAFGGSATESDKVAIKNGWGLDVEGIATLYDGIAGLTSSLSGQAYRVAVVENETFSTVGVSSSATTADFVKAWLKKVCATYPEYTSTLFVGKTQPSSQAIIVVYIYNCAALDTDGLPQYAHGVILKSDAAYRFSSWNGTFSISTFLSTAAAVTVDQGGTGGTTATQARQNLEVNQPTIITSGGAVTVAVGGSSTISMTTSDYLFYNFKINCNSTVTSLMMTRDTLATSAQKYIVFNGTTPSPITIQRTSTGIAIVNSGTASLQVVLRCWN